MGGCTRTWWTLLGLSSVVSKIDLVNFLTAKVHIHQTIFFGRSKRELMAYQGFANLVKRVAKGTLAIFVLFFKRYNLSCRHLVEGLLQTKAGNLDERAVLNLEDLDTTCAAVAYGSACHNACEAD